jgi:hypothetical protein
MNAPWQRGIGAHPSASGSDPIERLENRLISLRGNDNLSFAHWIAKRSVL